MRAKYFVTKHFNEGMVHHVGRVVESRKEAEAIAKRHQGKGDFRGKVYLRIWKMEKEITI